MTIDVYVSLNSPWTYLGWQRLRAIAAKHHRKLAVKPARFGEVFAVTGGLPLAKRAPARRGYRMMELQRWRDRLGTPIVLEPTSFPSDEMPGTHLLIAAIAQGHDGVRFAEEIGRSLWELDQPIGKAEVLAAAAKRAGINADSVLANAPIAHVLEATWAANTAEAISRGVFGAPSYVLPDGEIFWGQDRLDMLEWRLSGR